jgi:hypothetical protein
MELIEVIKNGFAIVALACVSYLSVTAAIAVHTLEKHTSDTLMYVDDIANQVDVTLAKINSKGGTLQQVDESVVRVKDLITLTQATLYKQQKSIDILDKDVDSAVKNLNAAVYEASLDEQTIGTAAVSTMAHASRTMDNANQALTNLSADEVSANTAIAQFTEQMDSLSPVVLSTLNNTNTTMANVAASTTDVKNFIHKETTPKKLTFWGGMEAGAVWAHKILMPSIF